MKVIMSKEALREMSEKIKHGAPTGGSMPCKVCGTTAKLAFTRSSEDGVIFETRVFGPDYIREYYRCPTCGLLFHIGLELLFEEEETDSQNPGTNAALHMIVNSGVREFNMVNQVMPLYGLKPEGRILVFGCGTGVSYNLFIQQGRRVYAPDLKMGFHPVREDMPPELFHHDLLPKMIRNYRALDELQEGSFDLITMTEVFEHFFDPVAEVKRLVSLLRPGGIVVGTTGWVDRIKGAFEFKDWWYVKCMTHSTFLTSEAFQRICAQAGCMGTLFPKSPMLIGNTNMSAEQCIFVIQRPEDSFAS